jgi:UrcA family protein
MKYKDIFSVVASQVALVVLLLNANLVQADNRHADAAATRVEVETVHFDDLDLASTAGAETLYDRLREASRKVCGTRPYRSLYKVRHWNNCYSAALDQAIVQIGNPLLEVLHAGIDPPAIGYTIAVVD